MDPHWFGSLAPDPDLNRKLTIRVRIRVTTTLDLIKESYVLLPDCRKSWPGPASSCQSSENLVACSPMTVVPIEENLKPYSKVPYGRMSFFFLSPFASVKTRVSDPDPDLVRSVDPDPDPGGQKMTHKSTWRKNLKNSCFEVLDVLFWELKASWTSFMEA